MLVDYRPFAAIIVNYVDFRQKLKNEKPDTESSLELLLSASPAQNSRKFNTTLMSWADKDRLSFDQRGDNLLVEEYSGEDICHVKVIKSTGGAKNENIELEDIQLNVVFLPAYLNRFYDFLSTGKWE